MCAREPKKPMRMKLERERDRRKKGNGLMEKRQYKVSVGGLPSLQEKYHSHTHSGSQDSPWRKHVGQTMTISVQSRPRGP